MTSIAIVGHITLDENIILGKNHKKEQIGGPAFYASMPFCISDIPVTVYPIASVEDKLLDEFVMMLSMGSEVSNMEIIQRSATVHFQNTYPNKENLEYRTQKVIGYKPEPIDMSRVKGHELVYVNLVTPDMTAENIHQLKENNGHVLLDAQSLLRKIDGEDVSLYSSQEIRDLFKYIDTLILDSLEAKALTHCQYSVDAAQTLLKLGPSEVLITSPSEFIASRRLNKNEVIFEQKFEYKGDPTGFGCRIGGAYSFKRPDDIAVNSKDGIDNILLPAYRSALELGTRKLEIRQKELPEPFQKEFPNL